MTRTDRPQARDNRYTFPKNTYYFFREMCIQEPLAAVCFVLAVACGVLLPFLSASPQNGAAGGGGGLKPRSAL